MVKFLFVTPMHVLLTFFILHYKVFQSPFDKLNTLSADLNAELLITETCLIT